MDQFQPEDPIFPPLISQLDHRVGTLQKLRYGICLDEADTQHTLKKLREERKKDPNGGDAAWPRWVTPRRVIVCTKDIYKLGDSEHPQAESTKLACAWLWETGSNRDKGCVKRAYDPSRVQRLKDILGIKDPSCKLQWYWTSISNDAISTEPYPSPWKPGGLLHIDCGWEEYEHKVILLYSEVCAMTASPSLLPALSTYLER